MRGLAIFDFDGTITRKDTMLELFRFHHGDLKFFLGMAWLSPWLVLMKLKALSNSTVKQKVLRYFFGGMEEADFISICKSFSREVIPALVKNTALDTIRDYQARGYRTILVSASASHWLKYWCEDNKLEFLTTRLEVLDGKITGRIAGENCYGKEKVVRINELLRLEDYNEVVAYGDSRGDREMLLIAHRSFYRHFN